MEKFIYYLKLSIPCILGVCMGHAIASQNWFAILGWAVAFIIRLVWICEEEKQKLYSRPLLPSESLPKNWKTQTCNDDPLD